MKSLILIIFLVVQSKTVTAQSPSNKIKSPTGDLNCLYKQKYSKTKRSAFYPFNIADTVKLVSFRYHKHNYPVKGDTLIIDSLIEIKTLTTTETHNLTDILYNNFYKRKPNYGILTQCFFPRNAILFLDKGGRLKEYIFLCFQCDRYELSSETVDFGDECTQKMEKLRQFFVSAGLRFGTDMTIEAYPGESIGE